MPFVKQIALCLNIGVSGYLFFRQFLNYQPNQVNSQITELLIYVLKASIVLLSPLLHILALMNPSYCYKGHCQPPHHYKKLLSQQKQPQIQHPYQHIQFSKDFGQKAKFQQGDLIQQSIASSSKDDFIKRQKQMMLQSYPKRQEQLRNLQNIDRFPCKREQQLSVLRRQKDNHRGDKKTNGIKSPPKLSKFSVSYEQLPITISQPNNNKLQDDNNSNVNEFSNIPFFGRSSHMSVSNTGNIESPRVSRRSIAQAGHESIVEPLMIKLTPVKKDAIKQFRQELNEFSSRANRQRRSESQMIRELIDNNIDDYRINNLNHSKLQPRPYDIIPPYKHIAYSQQSLHIQCEQCQQCHLPKYLRMKHCYRCSKCVHKYDHHCVLLNICIGEHNQKYYIAFLYAHFYNTCIVLIQLLNGINTNVTIDMETGIQSIDDLYILKSLSIILLLLNFVLTTYLIIIHTQFLFNGFTTYEKQRRLAINYFKYIKRNYLFIDMLRYKTIQEIENYHPFDQGLIRNVLNVITSTSDPIDWKLPFQQQQQPNQKMIEMKDRKQMAKCSNQFPNNNLRLDQYEWGEQSSSSNNFHAGKTTKSRQSAFRKSKQPQQIVQQKNNLCR